MSMKNSSEIFTKDRNIHRGQKIPCEIEAKIDATENIKDKNQRVFVILIIFYDHV